MEDYMGQISRNNNTNLLYGSSGGNLLYGGREEEASDPGGFHHHLQYNHNHNPTVVKIESGGYNQPTAAAAAASSSSEALKAKIISHPHYSNLLQAYMDCQKVGAPPEVVGRLSALRQEYDQQTSCGDNNNYKDPELDQFMEAYYDMLIKYKEELTRPIQEAMEFMTRIESQLSTLTLISSSSSNNNNPSPPPPPPRVFISPGKQSGTQ